MFTRDNCPGYSYLRHLNLQFYKDCPGQHEGSAALDTKLGFPPLDVTLIRRWALGSYCEDTAVTQHSLTSNYLIKLKILLRSIMTSLKYLG